MKELSIYTVLIVTFKHLLLALGTELQIHILLRTTGLNGGLLGMFFDCLVDFFCPNCGSLLQ